jgi:hypothetical protein
MVPAWPLLELSPEAGKQQIDALGLGFPYAELCASALESSSGYWQDHAIDWLTVLDLPASARLRVAAEQVLARKLASQNRRHALSRWLRATAS